MRVRVLGSAAGGGFPQWNCGCPNCSGVRTGQIRARPRTQESVAVSADGESWFLVNVSPEVRAQIEGFPPLHARALRDTPIAGVVLTNGDLDHCLGLLSLRESQQLVVYASERVRQSFADDNVLYRTLERFPGQVRWRALELGVPMPLLGADDSASGLVLTAVPTPGRPPLHRKEREPHAEDNVGLVFGEGGEQKLAYFSGVLGRSPAVDAALAEARAIFFDGTFWSNDELVRLGATTRTAQDMSHWPIGDAGGSLEYLAQFPGARRIFIHVNNTNPLLREDSAERARIESAGLELAYDGMELSI